jgi:hypothetical protein
VFVVRAADDRGAATLQRFTVVVAGSPNARIAGPVVGPAQDEVKAEDR